MTEPTSDIVAIVAELAQFDPMYESYQGNVSCVFCGAWEEADGKITHKDDCLWKRAKEETPKK